MVHQLSHCFSLYIKDLIFRFYNPLESFDMITAGGQGGGGMGDEGAGSGERGGGERGERGRGKGREGAGDGGRGGVVGDRGGGIIINYFIDNSLR